MYINVALIYSNICRLGSLEPLRSPVGLTDIGSICQNFSNVSYILSLVCRAVL